MKDNYQGGTAKLSDDQIAEFDAHLSEKVYLDANEICAFALKSFGITYTAKGMTNLLHRLGYCYKKPKHIPGKANLEVQKGFRDH